MQTLANIQSALRVFALTQMSLIQASLEAQMRGEPKDIENHKLATKSFNDALIELTTCIKDLVNERDSWKRETAQLRDYLNVAQIQLGKARGFNN